jgi:hypothetical protein
MILGGTMAGIYGADIVRLRALSRFEKQYQNASVAG